MDTIKEQNKQNGGIMGQETTSQKTVQVEKPEHERFYTIQGQKFRQTELTIGEDIKLIKVFKSSLTGDDPDTMLDSFLDLPNVEKLVKIILKGDIDAIDISKITNTELQEVLADFFLLNKAMINNFVSLGMFLNNPSIMRGNGEQTPQKSTT